jgi:hypothetical protein
LKRCGRPCGNACRVKRGSYPGTDGVPYRPTIAKNPLSPEPHFRCQWSAQPQNLSNLNLTPSPIPWFSFAQLGRQIRCQWSAHPQNLSVPNLTLSPSIPYAQHKNLPKFAD